MIFEGLEEGNVQRGEGRDRKGQRGDLLGEARMRRGRKEGEELFQRAREMFFDAHFPLWATASVLSLQQGFYADEVAAGAGHVTTATLLHDLRLVSTVYVKQVGAVSCE